MNARKQAIKDHKLSPLMVIAIEEPAPGDVEGLFIHCAAPTMGALNDRGLTAWSEDINEWGTQCRILSELGLQVRTALLGTPS